MIDIELIDGLADDVRAMLEEERAANALTVKELRDEVAELRTLINAIPSPAQIPAPVAKEMDPDILRAMVQAAVDAIPKPTNGKDADVEIMRSMVAEAVAEIPAPRDGANGKDADPDVIRALVEKEVAAIPKPRELDIDVVKGLIWKAVSEMPAPRDGRDAILTVTDEVGRLVQSEVERRVADTVQKAVDAAIGALPLMLYKGVWQEGVDYREGNTVTFGGSGWVCQKSDTTEKPGTGSDWILAIKKGRDGKDAR